jgi:hypothetical protein
MIYEIKKINLFSALKIALLIYLLIGFVMGLFVWFMMLIIGNLGKLAPSGDFDNSLNLPSSFGILGGLAIMVAYTIIIPIMGSIMTAIMIGLYNLFAGLWGGLKLELNSVPVDSSAITAPNSIQFAPQNPQSNQEGDSDV